MSHTDFDEDKRLKCASIRILDYGGYTVRRDEDGTLPGAAFSTLPEALAWLQRNMKQTPPSHYRTLSRTAGEVRDINSVHNSVLDAQKERLMRAPIEKYRDQ